jgi:hypothetical protein
VEEEEEEEELFKTTKKKKKNSEKKITKDLDEEEPLSNATESQERKKDIRIQTLDRVQRKSAAHPSFLVTENQSLNHHHAAVKIQRQQRERHVRKMDQKFSRLEERHHRAASKIQSLERGRRARRQYYHHLQTRDSNNDKTQRSTTAATRIQAIQRGRAERHRRQKGVQVKKIVHPLPLLGHKPTASPPRTRK